MTTWRTLGGIVADRVTKRDSTTDPCTQNTNTKVGCSEILATRVNTMCLIDDDCLESPFSIHSDAMKTALYIPLSNHSIRSAGLGVSPSMVMQPIPKALMRSSQSSRGGICPNRTRQSVYNPRHDQCVRRHEGWTT